MSAPIEITSENFDQNGDLSLSYNIRGIPALLIFHKGKPVDQIVGAVPKSIIQKKLDAALSEID